MHGSCLACSRCCYCRLPILTGDDGEHPGHGVVEQLAPGRGLPGEAASDLPGLRLVHRFCVTALASRTHRRAMRSGLVVRRARLGRATERYETGTGLPPRHDRLGLAAEVAAGARPSRWAITWRVRKMRYAALAAHRYYSSGVGDHYRRVR